VGARGQPSFRVRSDFTAALNADQGWAGALNENVTIHADRPFRVRFEVEPPPPSAAGSQFRLQYRRNQGEWTDLEAHDFPHPERELDVDFADVAAGATPKGWTVAHGNAARGTTHGVASGRFPDDTPPDDWGSLAPDLAVEVLSPRDRPRYVMDKVGEYLEAGVRLVWVIDPKKERAVVYRSLSDVRELGSGRVARRPGRRARLLLSVARHLFVAATRYLGLLHMI
jgi:hypothetical protein